MKKKNIYFEKPKSWYNFQSTPNYLLNIQEKDFKQFDFSPVDRLLDELKNTHYKPSAQEFTNEINPFDC